MLSIVKHQGNLNEANVLFVSNQSSECEALLVLLC